MTQALMIIDVQNDYFPNGKYPLNNTVQTLKNTLKLQKHFRQKQLPIIYIQHINQDDNAVFFVKIVMVVSYILNYFLFKNIMNL